MTGVMVANGTDRIMLDEQIRNAASDREDVSRCRHALGKRTDTDNRYK